MKKLCIGLAVILLISCGFLYRFFQENAAVRETEQQLLAENEELNKQLDSIRQSLAAKETEAAELYEEKKPVLEAKDIWQQRTEEIRSLLSD